MKTSLEEWCKKNNREILLKEWDYEKNGDLTPKDVSYGSGKNVWWKCSKCKYGWRKAINKRTSGNINCPVCANKTIVNGYNDLKTFCEKNNLQLLIDEFDEEKSGFSMNSVTKGSRKTAYWKCSKCGNEWKTKIYSRTSGSGCPCCCDNAINTVKKVQYIRHANDIRTHLQNRNIEYLLLEWDYEKNKQKPEEIKYKQTNSYYWICPKGHSYQQKLKERIRGQGCPYCSHHKVLKNYNDLETTHPALAKEWHPTKNGSLSPENVSYGSNKSVWWKCPKCGNEWKAQICNRVNGNGCVVCLYGTNRENVNLKSYCENNALFNVISEWDYKNNYLLDIFQNIINVYSSKKVWWICPICGKKYLMSPYARIFEYEVRNKCSCPHCKNIHKKITHYI